MSAIFSLFGSWRVPHHSSALGRGQKFGLAVGVAGGLALVAMPAQAQITDNDDGPALRGGILTTQITEGRSWAAVASFSSFYDDNFRRTSGTDQESALRLSPSVRANAGLPVGQQQLFIGGNYGRDYTIGQPEFNRSRWGIGGGAGWRLGSRCSGVIGAETSKRLNLVSDQAEFTPNGRKTTAFAATANCQSNNGLGIGGSFGRIYATNDRPENALFNVNTTLFAANLFYGSPTLGQFSLGGSINNNVYPERFVPTVDGVVEDGFSALSARLGYSRDLGSRLQLIAGVSYQTSKPKPGAILQFAPDGQIIEVQRQTFTGNGYDLTLNYTMSSRLSLNVNASRNISSSPNAGARFTIRQTYAANVNYDLSDSLSFSTGIAYLTSDFKDSFVSPDEPQARVRDEFTRVRASLNYRPGKLYTVGLQVAHQQRRSDPAIYSFNSTTALLNLSVNFGKG